LSEKTKHDQKESTLLPQANQRLQVRPRFLCY